MAEHTHHSHSTVRPSLCTAAQHVLIRLHLRGRIVWRHHRGPFTQDGSMLKVRDAGKYTRIKFND